MKTYPQLTVCEHCDRVYVRVRLARGEVAHCDACGALLYRAERFNIDQLLALTVAAAIVFVLANVYPIIRIGMRGMHNEATLWQSVLALGRGSAAPIAVPAGLAAIVFPFLQIALIGWVLSFARFSRRAPGFAMAMRVLNTLRPWSMVEVFLMSALVAIVKLSSFLSVVPGVGIWATAALTVLIPLIANRNMHWLWDALAGEQT